MRCTQIMEGIRTALFGVCMRLFPMFLDGLFVELNCTKYDECLIPDLDMRVWSKWSWYSALNYWRHVTPIAGLKTEANVMCATTHFITVSFGNVTLEILQPLAWQSSWFEHFSCMKSTCTHDRRQNSQEKRDMCWLFIILLTVFSSLGCWWLSRVK